MINNEYALEKIFQQINEVYEKKGNCIIGLSGLQGTGKTTLGRKLQGKFTQIGIKFITISIDDFYLSYEDRKKLDQKYYPHRGSPGTHDYKLLEKTFQDFKNKKDLVLPKFDKSLHNGKGDRIDPVIVQGVNILLLEGWFLGFTQVDEIVENLELPNKQQFNKDLAIYMNNILGQIQHLWNYLDYLIHIKTQDININVKWRLDAEQELRKNVGSGQTDAEIIDFMSYMWNCLHPNIYKVTSNYSFQIDDQRNMCIQENLVQQ